VSKSSPWKVASIVGLAGGLLLFAGAATAGASDKGIQPSQHQPSTGNAGSSSSVFNVAGTGGNTQSTGKATSRNDPTKSGNANSPAVSGFTGPAINVDPCLAVLVGFCKTKGGANSSSTATGGTATSGSATGANTQSGSNSGSTGSAYAVPLTGSSASSQSSGQPNNPQGSPQGNPQGSPQGNPQGGSPQGGNSGTNSGNAGSSSSVANGAGTGGNSQSTGNASSKGDSTKSGNANSSAASGFTGPAVNVAPCVAALLASCSTSGGANSSSTATGGSATSGSATGANTQSGSNSSSTGSAYAVPVTGSSSTSSQSGGQPAQACQVVD
jgi:hypothetical protein